MAAELSVSSKLLVLPFDGIEPDFATAPLFSGCGSSVLGRVTIGARAGLGRAAVIRADGHFVRIGDDFHIGEYSTVHIAHEVLPAIIGNRVTVGHNACVHACTVGDDCVVEDRAIVLDGSLVEDHVLIEAGSTVFPRSNLKRGFVYAGSPAKPVRELTSRERDRRSEKIRESVAATARVAEFNGAKLLKTFIRDDVFVASTARLQGHVELDSRSGVFFSCRLESGKGTITVLANTNIQDNTHIRCVDGDVVIGPNTTIGHNVFMQDCSIGQRSLVGIGSVVSAGTVLEDDAMLAGGAITDVGQHLGSGWLWGGRPARPIAKLDGAKRSLMHAIIGHYCGYGDQYRRAQQHLAQ